MIEGEVIVIGNDERIVLEVSLFSVNLGISRCHDPSFVTYVTESHLFFFAASLAPSLRRHALTPKSPLLALARS